MKRILFISTTDINRKDGGGLGQKAYYSSLNNIYPGKVDIIMPEEYVDDRYPNAKGVPGRNIVKSILSGSIHRYKAYVNHFLIQNKKTYELCVISGGLYAGDMMDMIHNHGLKIIVIHINFEREYQLGNKSLWTLWGHCPFFVIQNERNAYLKADCNCFMSVEDQKSFMKYYGQVDVPSVIVGAYEYEKFPDDIFLPENSLLHKRIAITGSLNTVQTVVGINDFRKNYYGIFRKICPDWTLLIAGRNPSTDIVDFKEEYTDNIELIPNPREMKGIIQNAYIYMCPTNVGGGIKLRVMDGLKNGRPILVHEVSARGYEPLFGYSFFQVYNDKQSFEKGLGYLVDYIDKGFNPNNIYNVYQKYYSFDAGTQHFKEAIKYLNI